MNSENDVMAMPGNGSVDGEEEQREGFYVGNVKGSINGQGDEECL